MKVEINDKGVFVNDIQVEGLDNVYSFEYENQKLPKIQTGASSMLVPIILLVISIITIIGITVFTFIKKKKAAN